jgi:hypothetical protein
MSHGIVQSYKITPSSSNYADGQWCFRSWLLLSRFRTYEIRSSRRRVPLISDDTVENDQGRYSKENF